MFVDKRLGGERETRIWVQSQLCQWFWARCLSRPVIFSSPKNEGVSGRLLTNIWCLFPKDNILPCFPVLLNAHMVIGPFQLMKCKSKQCAEALRITFSLISAACDRQCSSEKQPCQPGPGVTVILKWSCSCHD